MNEENAAQLPPRELMHDAIALARYVSGGVWDGVETIFDTTEYSKEELIAALSDLVRSLIGALVMEAGRHPESITCSLCGHETETEAVALSFEQVWRSLDDQIDDPIITYSRDLDDTPDFEV